MRSIGTTVAGAVMAIVLTSQTVHLGGTAIPTHGAFQQGFLIAAGAAIVAMLLTLLIPRKKAKRVDTAKTTSEEPIQAELK